MSKMKVSPEEKPEIKLLAGSFTCENINPQEKLKRLHKKIGP